MKKVGIYTIYRSGAKSVLLCFFLAAKKHAEFVRARWRHYSKEADAMKLARQLLEDDKEEDDDGGNKEGKAEEAVREEEAGRGPKVNGAV